MVVKRLKYLYRSPLPCYVTGWYLIFDIVTLTDILVTWPWYICTGTCHAILITWYLTPVLAMLHLSLDIWHRYLPWSLTCYHLVLVYLTWYCDTWLDIITPDTCISLHIHDYHFYGDLIITLSPDIWYSWTPILLNSCIPAPLEKGDSWYYTPVDPRNRITMNIGLLWTPCGHYHWTNYNN